MRRLLLALFLFIGFSVSVAGLGAPQAEAINLRAMGMGGVRLCVADDQFSLVNNPAATSVLRGARLAILQVQAVVSGDVFDIYDKRDNLLNLMSASGDISNETWNLLARLKISFGSTPVYFAMLNIFPGQFNLAAYNTSRIKVSTNPDIPIPSWNATIYNDTVFLANFSMPLIDFKYWYLHFGVTAKLINRFQMQRERMDFFALYDLTNLNLENLDVKRALALGMDMGILMQFGGGGLKDYIISITVSDFYWTRFNWTLVDPSDPLGGGDSAGYSFIQPSVNIGFLHKVETVIPFLFENLLLSIDFRNVLDPDVNFFLKIHFGAEIAFLQTFKLRLGFHQGYFAGGVGIDIPILPLEIDFAYWGEELGTRPGQSRLDNIGVTLNLRF